MRKCPIELSDIAKATDEVAQVGVGLGASQIATILVDSVRVAGMLEHQRKIDEQRLKDYDIKDPDAYLYLIPYDLLGSVKKLLTYISWLEEQVADKREGNNE